ncbi:MAG: response regulator [Parvularculaceae bacterium]|nr:response regulator [Parvularculaceae bacterium]
MRFASAIADRVGRLSFRSKMGLATIAACAATALIACIAFMINETLTYRVRFDREQKTLSEVLSANVTAAVLFGDESSARDILSATERTPQVDAAFVRLPSGQTFAAYARDASQQETLSLIEGHRGPRFASTILIDDEIVGELVLLTNLTEFETTLWRYSLIAALVFLGSTLFAIILARWESEAMATPMLRLRETIQSIRETRDYSSRVEPSRDKDFGTLIDNFNAMLEEIESRDERLESLVGDLISARDAAQSANTSKSQFLANMSHELRTPLNAIINYAEIIQEDLTASETDTVVSDVSKIQTAGLHLLGLINGILDLSKIEAGRMEVEAHSFDAAAILREAIDTIRPLAVRNGNRLDVKIDTTIANAFTDSVKFRQCVLNLVSNACKFTKDGIIAISASRKSIDGVDNFVVSISDTGIGMTPAQQASLFKAFVQADASTTRKYGGTGLGLAITQRLVTLLGGRISVASEAGVGSTFTFNVPCAFGNAEIESEEEAPDPVEPYRAGPVRTALIVDDDNDARDLLDRLARRMNYETIIASNGAEAISMAKARRPDVILLDLHMPVMDGWTALEKIQADPDLAAIPTIIVSVDDDSHNCFKLGAEDFFTKPINRIELERALLSYAKLASGDILIVEDNDDAADLLGRAAKNVGFRALRAPDGEAGLRLIEQHDVVGVILDLSLPGMDGLTFLNMLRASTKWRSLPVIVFSAQELDESQRAEIASKAQGYHIKTETSPRAVLSEFMNSAGAHAPATQQREDRKCAS